MHPRVRGQPNDPKTCRMRPSIDRASRSHTIPRSKKVLGPSAQVRFPYWTVNRSALAATEKTPLGPRRDAAGFSIGASSGIGMPCVHACDSLRPFWFFWLRWVKRTKLVLGHKLAQGTQPSFPSLPRSLLKVIMYRSSVRHQKSMIVPSLP